ncbi:MAG TPA: hypothetical protein VMI31_10100 [Fimbriimonadaceae bacterium]|nr:hypothetical protein [Fimbriimonadaceae bacterium]
MTLILELLLPIALCSPGPPPSGAYHEFRDLSIRLFEAPSREDRALLAKIEAFPRAKRAEWAKVVQEESKRQPVEALAPAFALAMTRVDVGAGPYSDIAGLCPFRYT